MADKVYNVLFLCTHNSARSILAEALLNSLGAGRFRAYSAGSFPKGTLNPLALETLRKHGHSTAEIRSKSWDEFAKPGAPEMNLVITVCDQAAGEACPVWPGRPVTAHWGLPDPSAVEGSNHKRREAFQQTYIALQDRIRLLLGLPVEKLDRLALKQKLGRIAHIPTE